jgi:hypothetical protein
MTEAKKPAQSSAPHDELRKVTDAQLKVHDVAPEQRDAPPEKGRRGIVTAPYVTYPTLVPAQYDPREEEVAHVTAHRGSVVHESQMMEGQFDRLLRSHPPGRKPFFVIVPDGVEPAMMLPRAMVGASSGQPNASAIALREAAQQTRRHFLQNLVPDDPEYPGPTLDDALAERARISVATGPGGYAPQYAPPDDSTE